MKDFNGFSSQELFELAIEKPVMAQLEITRNCNQSCIFCFRHCSKNQCYTDQGLDDWKDVIKKLVSIGVINLNISGGEVFLYSDFNDLIFYAKQNGIKSVTVNTNGIPELKNYQIELIDELVFSIHGLEEMHDNITGLPGAFRCVNKNLNYSLSQKIPVGINTVVCEENKDQLEDIYEYYQNYDLIFHAFNIAIDKSNLNQKQVEYSDIFKKYLPFLSKVPTGRKKLRHGMQNIVINDIEYYKKRFPLPHCAAGKYKLVIDHQGDVYPCRYFQTKDYYCGNVFVDDIQTIWKQGKGFKLFRDLARENHQLPDKCKGCIKKSMCRGGCLAWRIYNQKQNKYEQDVRCKFGDAYIGG